ncbi:MAG: hypothetical protein BMS9Abin03_207 [Thermodesulfobacteriota bacterium]|nr:MAG: hypothetical protein BMS9Abin03_207 [Thermodesulfobacteriota bacterium]
MLQNIKRIKNTGFNSEFIPAINDGVVCGVFIKNKRYCSCVGEMAEEAVILETGNINSCNTSKAQNLKSFLEINWELN